MTDRILNGAILGLGIAIMVLLIVLIRKEDLGAELIYIEVPMVVDLDVSQRCPDCELPWEILDPAPGYRPVIRNIRSK